MSRHLFSVSVCPAPSKRNAGGGLHAQRAGLKGLRQTPVVEAAKLGERVKAPFGRPCYLYHKKGFLPREMERHLEVLPVD